MCWNTEPAGIHAREPALARADPDQARSIDEDVGDQRAGQRAGKIAFGTQPDFVAVLGIERNEPFVRHGEPEAPARILGQRGDRVASLCRPDAPRGRTVDDVKAVVAPRVKTMRVIDRAAWRHRRAHRCRRDRAHRPAPAA